MQDLAAMAIFAQVIESKSFSAAADEVGLSKSAISKQISRLEENLGVRLINRTTRRLSLTDAGRRFYIHCARLVAEAQEAERAVTSLQQEPKGDLRINAPMSFANLHLAPLIPEFLARYPKLTLDLDLTDRYVDPWQEGYDLSIRIGRLEDSSLIARRIAPFRRVICAAPDYIARHGQPRHPRDLSQHNCLQYAYLATRQEWRFRNETGVVSVKVEGNFRANNGEALLAAAVGGLGIVLAPTFMAAQALVTGRLVPILTDWQQEEAAIYALYPHRRSLSAKVRVFIEFLSERFGAQPAWDKLDMLGAEDSIAGIP